MGKQARGFPQRHTARSPRHLRPPAVTAAQSATRESEGPGTAEGEGRRSPPASAVRERQRAGFFD